MARADLTIKTTSSATPITDLFAGATAVDVNGMQYASSGGRRTLWVHNESASLVTVTEQVPATVDGLDVPDRSTDIAAGAIAAIRETAAARQPHGKVHVGFSDSTSVSAVVVEDG